MTQNPVQRGINLKVLAAVSALMLVSIFVAAAAQPAFADGGCDKGAKWGCCEDKKLDCCEIGTPAKWGCNAARPETG